jgi:polyisoprenoid-binding protein YceI
MKKTIFSIVTLISMANAGGCLLTQSDDMNVTWKAYKTLAKLGVSGQFINVNYTANKKEGKNFAELFVGSKVSIDISKIDTKNEGRDKTLVSMFFDKLKGKTIDGVIKDIKADKPVNGKRVYHGVVSVSMTMNGKTLVIPMKYNYKNENFKATGTIDLFDFEAKSALSSINKSCYDLHKGKTWNDVTIGFSTTVKASLCDTNITKCKVKIEKK